MHWEMYLLAALTAAAIWKHSSKWLRVLAVLINLLVLDRYCVFLANVGRNTFEHTGRPTLIRDDFHEGVFAEAKAADGFARQQLSTIYFVAGCLGALGLWPALARKRGAIARPNETRRIPHSRAESPPTPASSKSDLGGDDLS